MTDPEDREQQADVTRRLLYHLNAPVAEHCRLLGVLPAPGAVRIAIRAGEGEHVMNLLYEIPNDTVTPYWIPGLLRTVLTGPQIYSSSDVDEVMGMTLIRLRPEEITPDPEPEQGRALTVVRALAGPGDDENPFLIGFLMHGDGLLRLYVQRPDRPGIIGADIRLTETPATALIASLPSLVEEEQYQRPAPEDPHCDLLVDLTNW
ncbi:MULTISPECIES: hypothetical protein [unclassified Streptomyces]|uniref:hypothetical protein n=1 Tax=unclassified Streptomyces TaxID=2593676 RepID=UPI002251D973|nr:MULTISPECIES: hypothetical protein [unclassified Streptomyces]MCX4990357.1 hypothetical protein [Streptomyces sp. NBC_00568]MCX5004412.1 hypothetical protein [Streptomyces sp. NBC_00638]